MYPSSKTVSKNIDERAQVPSNGRFYVDDDSSAASVRLPSYEEIVPFGVSPRAPPLTLTDCHQALKAAIRKARLIGFEIARTQKSLFVVRRSTDITLQGEPRDLDELLSSFSENMVMYLDLKNIAEPSEDIYDVPLIVPFQRLLCAHERFKRSNDQLKRSLLRVEKAFVQNVIEPLKQSFIQEENPPFAKLISQVSQCDAEARQAGQSRRKEVATAASEVEASPPWREVMALGGTIHDLRSKAEAQGWLLWRDKEFQLLNYQNMFDRADGPSSIISHFEKLVQASANTNSSQQQTAKGPSSAGLDVASKRQTVLESHLKPSISSAGPHGPPTPSSPNPRPGTIPMQQGNNPLSRYWWRKRHKA